MRAPRTRSGERGNLALRDSRGVAPSFFAILSSTSRTEKAAAANIETRRKETPIGIEGDWDAPEMDEIDPHLALAILREHKREIAGVKKPGRAPSVASNAEVFDALVKRLRAFGIRVEEEDRQEEERLAGGGASVR